MYTCSVLTLIQSCKLFLAWFRKGDPGVWNKVAAPPIKYTTCVSIHGRLLAIGGMNSDTQSTTAIHTYNPTTNSWEIISHMGTPRLDCITAVLPNNQLMVMGGYTNEDLVNSTDSVEFASVE
jgi:N-acetylneuraminic acid mutarotase